MVIALRRETHSSKNTHIYHIAHGFIYCVGTWLNAELSIPFEIECNIFWYKHLLGSPSQWPTQLLIQRRGFFVYLRRNNAPVYLISWDQRKTLRECLRKAEFKFPNSRAWLIGGLVFFVRFQRPWSVFGSRKSQPPTRNPILGPTLIRHGVTIEALSARPVAWVSSDVGFHPCKTTHMPRFL